VHDQGKIAENTDGFLGGGLIGGEGWHRWGFGTDKSFQGKKNGLAPKKKAGYEREKVLR